MEVPNYVQRPQEYTAVSLHATGGKDREGCLIAQVLFRGLMKMKPCPSRIVMNEPYMPTILCTFSGLLVIATGSLEPSLSSRMKSGRYANRNRKKNEPIKL